jgi:hypothetical protein
MNDSIHAPEGNRSITTSVKGTQITGDFSYISASDITVEITHPYTGLSTGVHIPYFGMLERRRFVLDGKITDRAYKSSEGLLKKLYGIGSSVEKHRYEMLKLLPKYEAEKKKVDNNLVALNTEKRVYRNLYKNSDITQQEYQDHLKRINKERFSLESGLRNLFKKLFGGFLPTLSLGMEGQVLSMLR